MRLDELRLTGFGRFSGKVIALQPGLNLLYGANEAGKSTIHRFIQAMLYGFAKPGLKKRMLLPEYEACRPWAGGEYRGTLVLTADDQRQYRMERDFARHRVQVWDNLTGRTLDFPADIRGESLVAQQLLGLTRAEFTSTVAIGQLQTSALDADQGKALADRMAALQATGREDESAARAVARLEEWQKTRVGTERARLSPLGSALAELALFKKDIGEVSRARSENLQREVDICRFQAELTGCEHEQAAVKAAIAHAEALSMAARLDQMAGLVAAAREQARAAEVLRACLAGLTPLAGLDPGEAERVPAYLAAYEEARAMQARAGDLVQQKQQELDRLARDLSRLAVPGDPAELEARADGLQAEVDRLQVQVATRAPGPRAGSRVAWWIAAAATVLLAAILAYTVAPWAFTLAVGAAPFVWLALRPAGAPAADLSGLQAELGARTRELQELWQQCGARSTGELKGRLRQAAALKVQHDTAAANLEDLRRLGAGAPSLTAALDRLLAPLTVAAPCSPALAAAVEAGTVTRDHVAEFSRLWETYRSQLDKLREAEQGAARAWARGAEEAAELAAAGHPWAGALEQACAGREVAGAVAAIAAGRAALPALPAGAPDQRTLAELEQRRDLLQDQIRALTGQVRELRGTVAEAYAKLRDLAELHRRREELETTVSSLQSNWQAMEKARQVIAAVAGEMHRNFAPRLAGRIGPMIAGLTGGRYQDVRIDEALQLTTEVPETKEFKPVLDLSSGTLDQFYFALRLGAALELTAGGERPPILCDDPLVQYDDGRALACRRLLAQLAAEYQILLFTCHRRELDAAGALGAHAVVLD